ncbi:hypothetical protein KDW_45740 [Dictyobacter vulcani]|uniref:Uncharacterized protein n=1 Tax=Dictyobacter vulcani TaxID=2607529 RepID=A0A5J4KTB9_9CHLR|nr:hypothetical protein [Dictyobacter vulcani]GER90412.1 hypothetical protein KDW_45740 [Dictyobacter vulcani]
MSESGQEQKMGSKFFLSMQNPRQRKIFYWIWHGLIACGILLLILCWQSALPVIGCSGDFALMMEKIEILLFILLLTSPLTRTLRQRLFPKTSPPGM